MTKSTDDLRSSRWTFPPVPLGGLGLGWGRTRSGVWRFCQV